MEKKEFLNPTIEVVCFSVEDVIKTSNGDTKEYFNDPYDLFSKEEDEWNFGK